MRRRAVAARPTAARRSLRLRAARRVLPRRRAGCCTPLAVCSAACVSDPAVTSCATSSSQASDDCWNRSRSFSASVLSSESGSHQPSSPPPAASASTPKTGTAIPKATGISIAAAASTTVPITSPPSLAKAWLSSGRSAMAASWSNFCLPSKSRSTRPAAPRVASNTPETPADRAVRGARRRRPARISTAPMPQPNASASTRTVMRWRPPPPPTGRRSSPRARAGRATALACPKRTAAAPTRCCRRSSRPRTAG